MPKMNKPEKDKKNLTKVLNIFRKTEGAITLARLVGIETGLLNATRLKRLDKQLDGRVLYSLRAAVAIGELIEGRSDLSDTDLKSISESCLGSVRGLLPQIAEPEVEVLDTPSRVRL